MDRRHRRRGPIASLSRTQLVGATQDVPVHHLVTATVEAQRLRRPRRLRCLVMEIVLWVLAVVLVVAGVVALVRKQLLWGGVLIVLGLLVGPGGVSLFT